MNEKIFREYDIRGIAGEDITGNTSFAIGNAFGSYLFSKFNVQGLTPVVSVGRDVRLSSEELATNVIDGITEAGIDVYDIGICPTPLQYFSIFHLNLDGGIMVTGSHNPPQYNGFKISIGKETIHGKEIQCLKEIVKTGTVARSKAKGKIMRYDIITAYKDHMLREFSYLNDPRYKRLRVVVDAGNATAGLIVPDILKNIGCEVIELYCEPDGNFPNHHPDPTVVEYMQDLIAETKNANADIGIGYDGDADRIGVVDRNGEIIWGDQIMIVLSREILKQNKGAKIIGDVKCSQIMFDDIKRHGGIPIMWKTGHSLVKQKMKDEGAILAGEFSGHIFIRDRYFGYDDAIYTTLRLIEIMKQTGKDIRALLSDIPTLFHTPEIRIDCPDDRKVDIVNKIVSRFIEYKDNGTSEYHIKDINTTDGVRILFDNGWGLIRSSNTQPVVVMRVEAKDEQSLNNYKAFLFKEFQEALQVA